jgi:hypothetical protein
MNSSSYFVVVRGCSDFAVGKSKRLFMERLSPNEAGGTFAVFAAAWESSGLPSRASRAARATDITFIDNHSKNEKVGTCGADPRINVRTA